MHVHQPPPLKHVHVHAHASGDAVGWILCVVYMGFAHTGQILYATGFKYEGKLEQESEYLSHGLGTHTHTHTHTLLPTLTHTRTLMNGL